MRFFLTVVLFLTALAAYGQNNDDQVSVMERIDSQSALLNEQMANVEDLMARLRGVEKELAVQRELLEELKTYEDNSSRQIAERKRMARESFDKAEKLRATKQYQSAGIYFSNALALEPDNLTILNSYTNTVLEWVSSRQYVKDYASAESTLNDYIRYLYTYSAGLDIKGVDYVASTFWSLADFREKLSQESAAWKKREEARIRSELETSINTALNRKISDNESGLLAEYHTLQGFLARWYQIAPDGTAVMERITRRQSVITDNLEAISLLSSAESGLTDERVDNISGYYKTNELYLINQRLAGLMPSLTGSVRARADKFNTELNNREGEISEDNSRSIWNNLNNVRRKDTELAASRAKTKEEAIQIWIRFADDVATEMSRAHDPFYAANMRNLLADVSKRTNALREEQLRLYESWSLNNVRTMYNDYSGELGLLSGGKAAKERLAAGMGDYLCPIDTRYLSVTSLKLYNDIYDFFNKELDRPMRINTALRFNNCQKKGLGDF